jgi:PAS domain S-box-containing protein
MDEFVTASVPARFAAMVEIDQFLATINEHAILTVTDPAGHLIYVNDAFCRLTQWDRSELIGQHYSLYSAEYHPDSFYEELWATVKAGSVWRGRVKNRAKDGSCFWIDSIVKPVLGPDGKVSHIISIRSDITELVETQEALEFIRQNEAAIRRILAISSSSIPVERMLASALEVLSLIPWLSDVCRSAVYLAAPGTDVPVLTAEHVLEVDEAGAEDRCLGECICRHVLETRTLQLAVCARQHDPVDGPNAIRHIAVPLAGQAATLGVLVFSLRGEGADIAKHKTFFADVSKAISVGIEQSRTQEGLKAKREQVLRKQQELEEKSALMAAGFDNMAEGLIALTPDLTIIAANKRFAELNEISPELVQQGRSFLPVLRHLESVVKSDIRRTELTVDGVRKVVRNGSSKPIKFTFRSGRTLEIRANPIPEVGTVFTVADVTLALLSEGRARRGRKLEALGELAGGVAHEYNNLLTSVQGYARMALKKLGNEDRVREALQEIVEASGRATEITQQMLTFSKKQVSAPMIVDVGEALRSMEPVLRVFLQSKLEIRFDIKSHSRASVDPALLTQCVSNLVTNSRQAMPDGGTITITCDTVELREPFFASHGDRLEPGRYISIAVNDSGRGIEPEVMPQIFDPFFTTREVGAGTGLGLSMVFGMAKNQNGAINVESTPGQGATFTIYLPEILAAPEQAGATTDAAPPAAPQRDDPPPIDTTIVPTEADIQGLMRFL